MKCVVLSCLVALTFSFAIAQQFMDCEYEGVTYPHGPFEPDQCNTCFCNDGTVKCDRVDCPLPICLNMEEPITSPDKCCPYCADEEK